MFYAFLVMVCAVVIVVICKMHALESAREAAETKAHDLARKLRELRAELANCKARNHTLQQACREKGR